MTITFKDEIHRLKKASLHFDLVPLDEDETPKLDTYFGGKPYVTDEIEIHECKNCKKNMEFICQFMMPVKNTENKKLYSFYYCFDCVKERGEGAYAINIYTNPSLDKMINTIEYQSNVPYSDVRFFPAYEMPEWEYCEESNPEFIRKLESMYGEKAFDVYMQLEQRVNDYVIDTGFKLKGYPSFIDFDEIPKCSKSNQLMEPFIQMESIPELNMDWLGKDSHLILFKSPLYDEFALRTIDFQEFDESLEEDIFEDADEDDDVINI
ncbi:MULTISPECIES: hypothetical protein [Bacillus cereus group]|uniref:DUF1963 domain-containing protein n=2 Tax=Bacillus cereus group TaxID=86661 RepID=A0A9X6SS85_BACCE|nr:MULTISPECIES: hypothetical protein [Bacillus cereus group]MDA1674797.1 hypothetical protein [Bacillus cereus group sp. TH152-1LC]PDZ94200.1 hypothetical protein CON36_35060 [Bacillus cereus]PFJ29167.1 hypothetical protein COJ15_32145 [Bacillus thuringiensis]PGP12723.1 hypothetical protein COA01_33430 [Bacillus cereus]